MYKGIGEDNSGVWGGVTKLQAGIDQIIGHDEELNGGAARLVEGFVHQPVSEENKPGLILGLDAYIAGVNQANEGAHDLYSGAMTLNGSMQAIIDGTKKLNTGAKTLAAGASQLKSGTSQLVENNSKLTSGAAALAAGASKLDDGHRLLPITAESSQTVHLSSAKARRSLPTVCLRSLPEHWN